MLCCFAINVTITSSSSQNALILEKKKHNRSNDIQQLMTQWLNEIHGGLHVFTTVWFIHSQLLSSLTCRIIPVTHSVYYTNRSDVVYLLLAVLSFPYWIWYHEQMAMPFIFIEMALKCCSSFINNCSFLWWIVNTQPIQDNSQLITIQYDSMVKISAKLLMCLYTRWSVKEMTSFPIAMESMFTIKFLSCG